MAQVVKLRETNDEPAVKTLIRVIETEGGDMMVTASDGLDKSRIVGNLMMAAVYMAGE